MPYSTTLGDKICEMTATSSRSLMRICEELNVPYSIVARWIRDENHELHDKYAEAKQQQMHHLLEEIGQIADESANSSQMSISKNGKIKEVVDRSVIARNKLRIEVRKFLIKQISPDLLKKKKKDLPDLYLEMPFDDLEEE